MANRTIAAYLSHLDVARSEIIGSQSGSQIVGIFPFDKVRQVTLLQEAMRFLDIAVCDTPETHPEITTASS